jgi:NADH-quinone oxidoreductase subunit J
MIEVLFYMFASVLVLSAAMVITANNPVHSVLWLVLAFFNAAGLFLLLGAEFVALILVIVYVGAVAVLFLFVVMMLDINFSELRKDAWRASVPVGVLVGGVLVAQLVMTAATWSSLPAASSNIANPFTKMETGADGQRIMDFGPKGVAIEAYMMKDGKVVSSPDMLQPFKELQPTNTHALGAILYTDYVYPFQVAGLILLVAMIGAITLTMRSRSGTRKQNINEQITRKKEAVIELRKVEKGAGIS